MRPGLFPKQSGRMTERLYHLGQASFFVRRVQAQIDAHVIRFGAYVVIVCEPDQRMYSVQRIRYRIEIRECLIFAASLRYNAPPDKIIP